MSADDDARSGGTERRCWLVVRLCRWALVAVVAYALAAGEPTLVVNAVVPLAVTFTPEAVKRSFDHRVDARLALWVAGAAFLHAVGALGVYRVFGWYDQLTHTVSATLVAGVGYAVVDALDRSSSSVEFPAEFRFVFILTFVLAFGVLWEIAEFATGGLASLVGGEPILAQYGTDDIVFDLLFNAIGAILVALWGTGYFDGVARLLARESG